MKRIILFFAFHSALVLTGCATSRTSAPGPERSASYEQGIGVKLDEVLRQCAASPGPGDSIYNQDTISIEIQPDGRAQGIAYRSAHAISEPWASCIEGKVKETDFSRPPQQIAYRFKTDVNWAAVLAAHPQLLTPRVKIKQAIRNNQSALQRCYVEHLKGGGRDSGKVTLNFEVLPDGQVKNIRAVSDEIKEKALLSCVEGVVSRIQLSPLEEKAAVQVSYPIFFRK